MTHRRGRIRLLVLFVALAGCGGGGRSGTGITDEATDVISTQSAPVSKAVDGAATAIESAATAVEAVLQGNVAGVSLTWRRDSGDVRFAATMSKLARALSPFARVAVASTGLSGIRVSVESTGIVGETDESGSFSLAGAFSGSIVVLFERDDGLRAALPVTVPRGAKVTLHDLMLGDATVAAGSPYEISFDGAVVYRDCLSRTVHVVSRFEPEGARFSVDFAGDLPRSASGAPIPCVAVHEGDAVHVDALLSPAGTIESGHLTLQDATPPIRALPDALPSSPHVPTLTLPAVALPSVPLPP